MKQQILVLAVGLSACALDSEADVDVDEVVQLSSKCPDPENCTVSNNGGVYTAELGYAGFGSSTGDFMITHFINTKSNGVTFEGRFQDTDTYWKVGTGKIVNAWYTAPNQQRLSYAVVSVEESMTTPTFTLRRGSQTPIQVTGTAIINNLTLDLYIGSLGASDQTPQFQVYWSKYIETQGNNSWIRSLNMYWRRITPTVGYWVQYCKDDFNHPDAMVFQQGLGIHAASGDLLVQDDSYVTMSCSIGAIAKAREWGFSYRTTQAQFDAFKATIHMKRASYCGDKSYYTIAGTDIAIWDRLGTYGDLDSVDLSTIEALWGVDGALCVNLANARHPTVQYPPPPETGSTFTGHCDFVTIPDTDIPTVCKSYMLPNAILASKLADTQLP